MKRFEKDLKNDTRTAGEKSKTDIQKNKYKGKAISYVATFCLSKYFPHRHYLQFAFGHLYTVVPNEPLFFHYSVKISLFTSLYSHPIELFPSPRGPNPLKAGYLSFSYNTRTSLFTTPFIGSLSHSHACTQSIKQGLFSK